MNFNSWIDLGVAILYRLLIFMIVIDTFAELEKIKKRLDDLEALAGKFL